MRTGPFGPIGPCGPRGAFSRALPCSAVLSLAVLTGALLAWPAAIHAADGPSATESGAAESGATERGAEGLVRLGGSRPDEGVVRLAVEQQPGQPADPSAGTVQLGPGGGPGGAVEQAPAPELEGPLNRTPSGGDSGPLQLYSSNPWSEPGPAADGLGTPASGGTPGGMHGTSLHGAMGGPMLFDESYGPQVAPTYWTGHYYLGDGIGYQDGYWTFGFFTPIYHPDPCHMIYTNSQMITTFDGRLGTNVGLGYRTYRERYIAGAHVWYDADESDSGLRYDQITTGLELLTNKFDIVLNGYFPMQTDARRSGVTAGTNPMFAGNQIVFQDIARSESALTGGDFQIGFPVLGNPWLKTWLGGYVYAPENADAELGFRAIVRGYVTDSASAELRVTDDNLFGTNVILGVNYNFNAKKVRHWKPSNCFNWYRQPCLADRMYEQPLRYYRVAVREQTGATFQAPAINPRTGQPYSVVHVNATAAPGGNGSFERPFNTLAAASGSPADMILVQQDGTSAANPLAGPVALNDFTRLLGEGQAHFFDAQARGRFQLPAPFEATGPAPFIAAPGANVVTLADNNEVNSFNILTADGFAGIAGNEVDNFRIANINRDAPVFTGPGSGIVLTDAAGEGRIENVRFNSSDKDAGEAGVSLQANGEALTVTVDNLNADFNANGLELRAINGGTITAAVSNSSFDNAAIAAPVVPDLAISGILISADDTSAVDADFTTVTANDSLFNAARIIGNGDVDVLFSGVTATNAVADGLFINMGAVGAPAQLDADIINSTFVGGPGQRGMSAQLTQNSGSTADFFFSNQTFMGGNEPCRIFGATGNTITQDPAGTCPVDP